MTYSERNRQAHGRIESAYASEINRVGDKFETDARNHADIDDQTGNLRSSIDYIILYDGKVVQENFEATSRGTDKAEGVRAGREHA